MGTKVNSKISSKWSIRTYTTSRTFAKTVSLSVMTLDSPLPVRPCLIESVQTGSPTRSGCSCGAKKRQPGTKGLCGTGSRRTVRNFLTFPAQVVLRGAGLVLCDSPTPAQGLCPELAVYISPHKASYTPSLLILVEKLKLNGDWGDGVRHLRSPHEAITPLSPPQDVTCVKAPSHEAGFGGSSLVRFGIGRC